MTTPALLHDTEGTLDRIESGGLVIELIGPDECQVLWSDGGRDYQAWICKRDEVMELRMEVEG